VECQKRKFCVRVGNPPSVELCPIRSREPNIFGSERSWMPVTFQPSRVIGKKDHAALKYANDEQ